MDLKKLEEEALEQISGGWEFPTSIDWLSGTNITCPYCGSDDFETVRYRGGTSKWTANFDCLYCNKRFYYYYYDGKVYIEK